MCAKGAARGRRTGTLDRAKSSKVMDPAFLLLTASAQNQRRANQVASIVAASRNQATHAAIQASASMIFRSWALFLDAPVHVIHLDEALLALLGGPRRPHALVFTANTRRHLVNRPDRPNSDQIRDAMGRIEYICRRKAVPSSAELVGRDAAGRLQIVGIAVHDATPQHQERHWLVKTAWWINEAELRRYKRRGYLQPVPGRAV